MFYANLDDLIIAGSTMTDKCRAALWYSKNIEIRDTKMHGIKVIGAGEVIMDDPNAKGKILIKQRD